MKKIALGLLALCLLSAAASAEDLNAQCCRGLATGGSDAYNSPVFLPHMRRKDAIDTDRQFYCDQGRAMSAISFRHKFGENLTYQEDVGPSCASFAVDSPQYGKAVSRVSAADGACQVGDFVSKTALYASASAPPNYVISGIRFTHARDHNLVYEERFLIYSCQLQYWARVNTPARTVTTTNWHLESNANCGHGFITGIGFRHAFGKNETSDEFVTVTCQDQP